MFSVSARKESVVAEIVAVVVPIVPEVQLASAAVHGVVPEVLLASAAVHGVVTEVLLASAAVHGVPEVKLASATVPDVS